MDIIDVRIEDPAGVWRRALGELKLQMTQVTFDTWLLNTRVIEGQSNGDLVVECKDGRAVDWLEHRLGTVVGRTLRRIVGRDVDVEWVAREGIENQESRIKNQETRIEDRGSRGGDGGERDVVGEGRVVEELLALAARIGDRDAQLVVLERVGVLRFGGNGGSIEGKDGREWVAPPFDASKGWFRVTHYESRFWGALLGAKAFRLWQAIVRTDRRKQKTDWTPPRGFSAPELAREVGCSKQLVAGVWRRCRPEDRGAVLRERVNPMTGDVGEAEFFRRRPEGLVWRLEREGVAEVRVRGSRSRKVLEISVPVCLGWLNPEQLGRLSNELRVEHDRLVEGQGLDPRKWR